MTLNKLSDIECETITVDGATTVGELRLDTNARNAYKRATIAELNAGVAFLPAVPGFKYRVTRCKMTAIGGAVTAVTTVDVLGTQSTSSAKLFAAAQAKLTENTMTSSAVVAEIAELSVGASNIACDANTAITLGITGSDITIATHVDVVLDYVLEAA